MILTMKKMAKKIAGEMLKDERTLSRLVARNSFADVYWEVIKELTARNEEFTYREVFQFLNSEREKKWGESAFPSYEAFYMWLKRRN